MIQFSQETQPTSGIRLLILRKNEQKVLNQVVLSFTHPSGQAKSQGKSGQALPGSNTSEEISSRGFSFVSQNMEQVLARAPNGTGLTQKDVDIFGGVMAWSFGTRLTEGQKVIIKNALKEF